MHTGGWMRVAEPAAVMSAARGDDFKSMESGVTEKCTERMLLGGEALNGCMSPDFCGSRHVCEFVGVSATAVPYMDRRRRCAARTD